MKEKITRYRDIPQFTRRASYAVDVPPTYLLPVIQSMISEQGLNLTPEFQRGHVWTEQQQIAYLEFFMRGGLTGRDLYFNNPSQHATVPEGAYNEFVCVDGLQRITAWERFLKNEIPVFNSYFCEFTDRMPITQTMRIHINDLGSEEEVIRWYLEMNAGGTPHSDEEIERVRRMLARITGESEPEPEQEPGDNKESLADAYKVLREEKQKREKAFEAKKELLKDAMAFPAMYTCKGDNETQFYAGKDTVSVGQVFYMCEPWRLREAGYGSGGMYSTIEYMDDEKVTAVTYPSIVCSTDKEYWGGGTIDWSAPDAWKPPAEMPPHATRQIYKAKSVMPSTSAGLDVVCCEIVWEEENDT